MLGAALLALTLPPPSPDRQEAGLLIAPSSAADSAFVLPGNGAATVAGGLRQLDLDGQSVSADVRLLGQWVVNSAVNGNRTFAIVDKKVARVFVFAPDGKLRGASAVLLGHAPGDDSVTGIGNRPIAEVRPEERTTPAGRFEAEPGRNALGEQVVWVDYDAAVSMHATGAGLACATSQSAEIPWPAAIADVSIWPGLARHFSPKRGRRRLQHRPTSALPAPPSTPAMTKTDAHAARRYTASAAQLWRRAAEISP